MIGRRAFLRGVTVAGATALVAPGGAAADAPPETTRLRLFRWRSLCVSPQFIAEDLLRVEGFTDIQYVGTTDGHGAERALASGEVDINSQYSAPLIVRIEAGAPVVFLAGLHVGCFELFAKSDVKTIRDLRGKVVAVHELGSVQHVFVSTIVGHVGLDPRKDLTFAAMPPAEGIRRLTEGTVDAFLGFPPDPLELRRRNVGHVLLNSTVDRPWSQYFCCMVAGNRDFVRKHPVATKRALRALLKANQICALEPERSAQRVVDGGFVDYLKAASARERYDYTLQTLKSIPYARWRQYDPEDTIRFYSLRLREAGMIAATPQRIITTGTDWRFLNELKRELKG
jgi:NitT/TauT family transport system substrate-binding protein